MDSSIKAIFDVGDQIQQALKSDDLEQFYALVDEREKLIDRLKKKPGAVRISKNEAAELKEQFQRIVEALNQKEQQMIDQLNKVDQFRKAGRSYHTHQPHRQFINKNLMG